MRKVGIPIQTCWMSKRGLRATEIKVGEQCLIVQTEDVLTGKSGVSVLQDLNAKTNRYFSNILKDSRSRFADLIERQFDDFSSRVDIIDMHPISSDYTSTN